MGDPLIHFLSTFCKNFSANRGLGASYVLYDTYLAMRTEVDILVQLCFIAPLSSRGVPAEPIYPSFCAHEW